MGPYKAKVADVCWANARPPQVVSVWAAHFLKTHPVDHWSRRFEYPWACHYGKFDPFRWVLDAAGGDSPFQTHLASLGCQVVNADHDPSRWPKKPPKGVLYAEADLRDLSCFADDVFDRVACISVLEHIGDCGRALDELWRVLKCGGRLLLTLDVADYVRHNHTIDEDAAATLLRRFGALVPPKPADVLVMRFDELLHDGFEGRPHVHLNVLCVAVDKAG